MRFYWNEQGDWFRKTEGSGIFGLEFALYKKEENTVYIKYVGHDSLLYYNGSDNNVELIDIVDGPYKVILGQKCRSLIISSGSPIQEKEDTPIYYYSGTPYLDWSLYTGLEDGFANLIYKKTNAPFLEITIRNAYYELTYTATEIIEERIPKEFFNVPKNLPKGPF